MILETDSVKIQGGFHVKREKSFGIAPAAMAHICDMLAKMYSDPGRAVAREYLANAVDSCRLARKLQPGITLPPIDVTTPSRLDPTYTVRDYGMGMTEDETEDLLSNFGASGGEKRSSNEYCGGFGVGSKSAFSLTDTFSFTVWHGGRKRIWVCTIRADAAKAIQLLSDTPSDEPRGVKVEVPVKLDDMKKVCHGVAYVMATLNEPVKLNGTLHKQDKWTLHDLGDGVSLISGPKPHMFETETELGIGGRIVVGDFSYPFNSDNCLQTYEERALVTQYGRLSGRDKFSDLLDETKAPVISSLMRPAVCFRLESGALKPSPNRESLVWDSAATKKVQGAMKKLQAVVRQELLDISASAKSPLDALRTYRILASSGLLPDNTIPKWGGKTIELKDLPKISKPADTEGKFIFPKHRRMRGGRHVVQIHGWDEHAKARAHDFTSDPKKTISYFSNRSSVKAVVGADLYLVHKYKLFLAEPMSNRQLVETMEPFRAKAIDDWKQANPGSYANPSDILKLDEYVVVMGTEDQRKAILKSIEWATEEVLPVLFKKPPKVPRAPKVPGAPRSSDEASSSMGWMKATKEGWDKSIRPKAGTTVYFTPGRVGQVESVRWHELHELWDGIVPGFKGLEFYSLTDAAIERTGKHYKMVDIKDGAKEWMNAWANLDDPKFDLSSLYWYLRRELFHSKEVPPENLDDYEQVTFRTIQESVDDFCTDTYVRLSKAPDGSLRKLLELVMKWGDISVTEAKPRGIAPPLVAKVRPIESLLSYVGPQFTLDAGGAVKVLKKVQEAEALAKALVTGRPELVPFLADRVSMYDGEAWSKDMLTHLFAIP